ncbi:MAG: ArsR/SmtB family transcription factor [Christensenellales bacterium]|jgi:DNA-binding transcriptional ArsR family regulator
MMNEWDEQEIERLSELFKLFGSTSRMKIILALDDGEQTVSALCGRCGMNQSALSHQLHDLRANRIVKARKEGLNVYYSLDDMHIVQILHMAMQHMRHEDCD